MQHKEKADNKQKFDFRDIINAANVPTILIVLLNVHSCLYNIIGTVSWNCRLAILFVIIVMIALEQLLFLFFWRGQGGGGTRCIVSTVCFSILS